MAVGNPSEGMTNMQETDRKLKGIYQETWQTGNCRESIRRHDRQETEGNPLGDMTDRKL